MSTYAISPYAAKYSQFLAVPTLGDLDAYARAVNGSAKPSIEHINQSGNRGE